MDSLAFLWTPFGYASCSPTASPELRTGEKGSRTVFRLNMALSTRSLCSIAWTSGEYLALSDGRLTIAERPFWWIVRISPETDAFRFETEGGEHLAVAENGWSEFKILPYRLKEALGIVHWGGKYAFTDRPYLVEGAEMVKNCQIRNFKVYLGRKSPSTYEGRTGWPLVGRAYEKPEENEGKSRLSLVEIARQADYRTVFEMGFERMVIVCHARGDYASSPEPDRALLEEEAEMRQLALELGRYPRTLFVLTNWEADGLIGSKKTDERYAAMVRWVQARQNGVRSAGCSNVRHGLELNHVVAAVRDPNFRCVANQVLPRVSVDYVSYSCYDATTEEQIEACVRYIRSQMAEPTPLIFGEFGVAMRRKTDAHLESYVTGMLNVCKKYGIELAFYWQLYDNERELVDGKWHYRGFSLVDVEQRVNSLYFLFRFVL